MYGTVDMKDIQVQAVIREYLKAVMDGAFDLAHRIYMANPDLRRVLWKEYQKMKKRDADV